MRSPTGWAVIGVLVTILVAGAATALLSNTDGKKAVEANAPLIAAVLALGGVGTTQMVSISLAHNRAQEEALQTYLAEMSELLLDKCLHQKSDDYDAARVTARLQTLALLERLEAGRKRTVLLFLREAQLIHRCNRLDPNAKDPETGKPKMLFYAHYVGLREADLSGAHLQGARLISTSGEHPVSLKGANLKGAKLHKAILPGADLSETDLGGTDLRGADLSGIMGAANGRLEHRADLSGADLNGTRLQDAKLHGADLRGALRLTQEQLELAIGDEKTQLPPGLDRPAHWDVQTDQQTEGH
jgi:uncharacterized protein YjbI with pentapeptide repeats